MALIENTLLGTVDGEMQDEQLYTISKMRGKHSREVLSSEAVL